ncbi:Threonine dehydratase [Halalkaliarchaeum sp. AArc-CO]|uniref:threonine ammonia-lyase n=1 Tax=unclassified Halalkaliarchaeum TaxID=2678344 RepID=UPI00217D190C|nr:MULTISPECIES: threonine ammonia-lyase [unclassified Halalkaliarchaeum]MDR5673336.1 threonine ammonia-lyase [Halalkaliarchaeum sp. AArc-GB]UWG49677.1 Threonine dehydratase [Halalkaliarchaeum sp. AArc-CO]
MLTLEDVLEADDRIRDVVRWTPLERSHSFSEETGADVALKLENFQRTGAFKIRGALNRIETLDADRKQAGVITASAGNHAQGVALAATRAGVDSTIVMPKFAPISKVKATRRYGGTVILHGEDYDAAQAHARELAATEDRTYVHAFDDEQVMAGQGTIGLEIVEDCPEVDTVVVPIGGGGLIAGIATAVTEQLDDVRVIGVQAAGASSAKESLERGEIYERDQVDTIADGIATRRIGDKPFAVMQERVDEVVTVTDREIALALTLLLERTKALVEGAGAVSLAAVLSEAFDYEDGETIVPALCGGNINLNQLTTVVMRGLVQLGRYLKIRTVLKDRPGALQSLVDIIAESGANIYAIHHDRTSRKAAVNAAEVELEIETHDTEHAEELIAKLRSRGYAVDVLD